MTTSPHDFDKTLDLHESEWKKAGKREPFFGPGAFWFFRVTVPLLAMGGALSIAGRFIYHALLGY